MAMASASISFSSASMCSLLRSRPRPPLPMAMASASFSSPSMCSLLRSHPPKPRPHHLLFRPLTIAFATHPPTLQASTRDHHYPKAADVVPCPRPSAGEETAKTGGGGGGGGGGKGGGGGDKGGGGGGDDGSEAIGVSIVLLFVAILLGSTIYTALASHERKDVRPVQPEVVSVCPNLEERMKISTARAVLVGALAIVIFVIALPGHLFFCCVEATFKLMQDLKPLMNKLMRDEDKGNYFFVAVFDFIRGSHHSKTTEGGRESESSCVPSAIAVSSASSLEGNKRW